MRFEESLGNTGSGANKRGEREESEIPCLQLLGRSAGLKISAQRQAHGGSSLDDGFLSSRRGSTEPAGCNLGR